MLRLYHDQVIGKIGEYEGKQYLMVDVYMLDKVWDKIKEIAKWYHINKKCFNINYMRYKR